MYKGDGIFLPSPGCSPAQSIMSAVRGRAHACRRAAVGDARGISAQMGPGGLWGQHPPVAGPLTWLRSRVSLGSGAGLAPRCSLGAFARFPRKRPKDQAKRNKQTNQQEPQVPKDPEKAVSRKPHQRAPAPPQHHPSRVAPSLGSLGPSPARSGDPAPSLVPPASPLVTLVLLWCLLLLLWCSLLLP